MTMRLIPVCFAALLLAGCAGGGLQSSFGGGTTRPKMVLVSDFVISSEVETIDRGYTARLERKTGAIANFERKQRTAERINDEIVASIVASLREAGFDAQPGNEDALMLGDDALIVSGRLRGADPASTAAKSKKVGFGAGYGGVAAEISLSQFSSTGKRQLVSFAAEGASGRKGVANAKLAAANNAAINAALTAQNPAQEKLSPDVEAQARGLGRAVGEKVVAFAKEQGWLTKAEGGEAAGPVSAEPREKPVRMPEVRPQKKPPQPTPEPDEPDKN